MWRIARLLFQRADQRRGTAGLDFKRLFQHGNVYRIPGTLVCHGRHQPGDVVHVHDDLPLANGNLKLPTPRLGRVTVARIILPVFDRLKWRQFPGSLWIDKRPKDDNYSN